MGQLVWWIDYTALLPTCHIYLFVELHLIQHIPYLLSLPPFDTHQWHTGFTHIHTNNHTLTIIPLSSLQYICGSILVFVFLNALEGVIMSLLSKLVSPELAKGTFNSGKRTHTSMWMRGNVHHGEVLQHRCVCVFMLWTVVMWSRICTRTHKHMHRILSLHTVLSSDWSKGAGFGDHHTEQDTRSVVHTFHQITSHQITSHNVDPPFGWLNDLLIHHLFYWHAGCFSHRLTCCQHNEFCDNLPGLPFSVTGSTSIIRIESWKCT